MAISLGKVFEPFVEQRPICVMARGVLENLFNADKIDALFARTAEVQYTRELLFSSVVDLMGQVVLGVQPSVHAAYQAQAVQLGISDQAVYDKLRQVELRVSAELVRDAARQAAPVIGALQAELPPLVPGYRAKILDGNHLAASAHRLEALNETRPGNVGNCAVNGSGPLISGLAPPPGKEPLWLRLSGVTLDDLGSPSGPAVAPAGAAAAVRRR